MFPEYLDVKVLIVFLSPSSQIMDRLIWYLRIVHSVDYYTVTVFPSEDCMPHRCGIITARGQKPNAVTQEEGTSTCPMKHERSEIEFSLKQTQV